jgi:hypothetical protein
MRMTRREMFVAASDLAVPPGSVVAAPTKGSPAPDDEKAWGDVARQY